MEIYTATLIVKKHREWLEDKKNLPKVNEEKLKEAINLLTDLKQTKKSDGKNKDCTALSHV